MLEGCGYGCEGGVGEGRPFCFDGGLAHAASVGRDVDVWFWGGGRRGGGFSVGVLVLGFVWRGVGSGLVGLGDASSSDDG